jgi:hypothetical protein
MSGQCRKNPPIFSATSAEKDRERGYKKETEYGDWSTVRALDACSAWRPQGVTLNEA